MAGMKVEKDFTPLLVVACALSDGEGRWLMHCRPPHKQHGGLWEFPGGKVEPGEDCRMALVREIAEETTLRIPPGSLREAGFAVSSPTEGSGGIVLLLYAAERWEGELTSPEGGHFAWLDRAQIESLAMPPLDVVLARQLFSTAA